MDWWGPSCYWDPSLREATPAKGCCPVTTGLCLVRTAARWQHGWGILSWEAGDPWGSSSISPLSKTIDTMRCIGWFLPSFFPCLQCGHTDLMSLLVIPSFFHFDLRAGFCIQCCLCILTCTLASEFCRIQLNIKQWEELDLLVSYSNTLFVVETWLTMSGFYTDI